MSDTFDDLPDPDGGNPGVPIPDGPWFPAQGPLERAREAAKHAETARDEFEQAIREAAKVHSLREVGKAVGLTHSRVHQIIHNGRKS